LLASYLVSGTLLSTLPDISRINNIHKILHNTKN